MSVEDRKPLILIGVSSISTVVLLGLIYFDVSHKMRDESLRDRKEVQQLTAEVKHLNETIAGLRAAPLVVSVESLPALPAPSCTVTLPPDDKKKRGRR